MARRVHQVARLLLAAFRPPESKAGQIGLPPIEIVELVNGAPATQEPAQLRERGGWLSRIGSHTRIMGRKRASRFVLDPITAPVETLQILQHREDFALLEIDPSGRPVLHVLPGMSGELRIGVSCMTVAHMLADPSLEDLELGGARLPLAYGARVRIRCGPRVFVARIGGPPLMHTMLPAAPTTAASVPQLLRA